MSQVNFVEQFNLFMLYSRRNKLTSYERIFYLGLFHCANDLARQTENFEWPDDYFPVSNVELNGWTGFDERAIRNTRNSLKQKGLLDFQKGDGKKSDPMYRIFYLRKTGYKIAPDIPAGIHTGSENAAGQAIGGENAAGQKEGTKSAAKTQPVKEEPTAKTQPITRETEPTACEFAPDCVGDPVGDTVGDPVGGAVAIDGENAADHFIINKLNVNLNANTPPPEEVYRPEGKKPAEGKPLYDPAFGRVMSYYMDRFDDTPSMMAVAGLKDFTSLLGDEVVIHAMDIALAEQKKSWSYIRGILNRYKREGLDSIGAVELSEERFEESQARRNTSEKAAGTAAGNGLVDPALLHGGLPGRASGFGRM